MMVDPNKLTSKSALGRLVRLPLRLLPGTTVMHILSGPNKGARWRTGSSVAGCWVGTYEGDKPSRLAEAIRPGMTVWDVGANAGYYTVMFSRLIGSNGRCVAFEPFAENSVNLLDHVEWNARHNTQIIQAAVGSGGALAGFEINEGSNSMGHVSDAHRGYLVPTVSLDHCVDREGFAVPDVVKMDIEGAEVDALRGAARILAAHKTTWFISLHGEEARLGCGRLLSQAGYRLTSLDGAVLSPGLEDFAGDEIVARPAAASAKEFP